MGRFYSGDIDGKFWFAIQPSDDAEQFGAVPEFEKDDECFYVAKDIEKCTKQIEKLFKELGVAPNFEMTEDDVYKQSGAIVRDLTKENRAHLHKWASLDLGLKIYKVLKETGVCKFEAQY